MNRAISKCSIVNVTPVERRNRGCIYHSLPCNTRIIIDLNPRVPATISILPAIQIAQTNSSPHHS